MDAIIESYLRYNHRRYSLPWVCEIHEAKYDFKKRVGVYTGEQPGDAGDLVVFDPVVGQVYAYGQKDYRGNNTEKKFAKWDGEKFVRCDILGREKE